MKIIETHPTPNQSRWHIKVCYSCRHVFTDGEKRVEWRLRVPTDVKYHNGSFWEVHCPECAVNLIRRWIGELAAVNTDFLLSPNL